MKNLKLENYYVITQMGGDKQMDQNDNQNSHNSSGRGFAAMDPEEQRNIASKGGRAAHKKGVAHEWDSEEASQASKSRGSSSTNDEG